MHIAAGIVAVLLLVPIGQYMLFASFPGNAQKFVKLPNIKLAKPGDQIPPTDPNHLVLVTKSIAQFKGQNALGDIASRFHIDIDSYTMQSVNGHRYWIAPLVVFNFLDTLNVGAPTAPGYVVVDAEDPEAEAELRRGYSINVWPDQIWGLNLQRLLYLKGYNNGSLAVPKFEVDDKWNPYWVVSFVKAPFGGGTSGEALSKVILVKLGATNEITEYDPSDAKQRADHAWVDRAMPSTVVFQYLTDWGWFGSDYARKMYWRNWSGMDKTDTIAPTEVELSYTTGEENVYVVPMASTNQNNNGVSGVVVYETNRNEATYYPELRNFNVPESVKSTFASAPANAVNKYDVEHVQLVSIDGHLTWVAIYAAPQAENGKGFGGIGLLHAHSQSQADVVYATDKATALQLYESQIANGNRNGGNIAQTSTRKELTGTIAAFAPLPSNSPTYVFKILEDPSHTFVVTRKVYGDIPFVEKGDKVTFSYVETKNKDVSVSSFSCPRVDNLGKASN